METAKTTSFSSTVRDQAWDTVADYAASRFSYRDHPAWLREVRAGNFVVNEQTASETTSLLLGDKVTWTTMITEPEVNRDIRVLYEDEDVLAVNKPAPLPCHAKAPYFRNTLISILRETRSEPGLRIAHRLDKGTTGVMLLAKNTGAMSGLSKQFEKRTIKKTYLALCAGEATWTTQKVELALGRSEVSERPKAVADPNGKAASTEFELLDTKNGNSLIEARPLTGRMHQIRAHLGSLGLPIVGDELYGGPVAEEIKLHAQSISFTHPTNGETMTLQAPCPWSIS